MLIRLRNREIATPPPEADFVAFLLSGGGVQAEESTPAMRPLTLGQLKERYFAAHGNGVLEATTLRSLRLHLRHFIGHFGERQELVKLTSVLMQGYVDERCRQDGYNGRKLSTITVTKELGTLRAAWNWAVRIGALDKTYPGRSLVFPKGEERPDFQTWAEIERRIARGGLTKCEIKDLWSCLFLTKPELDEFLEFARVNAAEPHLHPMLAFAAHSGARRSELLRLRIDDVDFEAGQALIRECKKARGLRTTRRVPLSGYLKQTLRDWLTRHPGGPMLFLRINDEGEPATSLTPDEVSRDLRRLRRRSKWKNLRGWHVLRHSFVPACAAEGVDQRVLQS
jgi:integrase